MKTLKVSRMIWTSTLHELIQNTSLLKFRNKDVAHQISLWFVSSYSFRSFKTLRGRVCFNRSWACNFLFFFFIRLHSFANAYCPQIFISFKLLVHSPLFNSSCLSQTCDLENWMIEVLCFILSPFC